jgi:CRP-like cAMP-binding protein
VAQPDGRRQIVELLPRGDFFGFTALDEYDSTIEAVAKDTIVAGLSAPAVRDACRGRPATF